MNTGHYSSTSRSIDGAGDCEYSTAGTGVNVGNAESISSNKGLLLDRFFFSGVGDFLLKCCLLETSWVIFSTGKGMGTIGCDSFSRNWTNNVVNDFWNEICSLNS